MPKHTNTYLSWMTYLVRHVTIIQQILTANAAPGEKNESKIAAGNVSLICPLFFHPALKVNY